MRIANVEGRLKLLVGGGAVDVEGASGGRFGADPHGAYERFDDLRAWADTITGPAEDFLVEAAGPPSPSPRQVFAIGLNYRDHAAESGFEAPAFPVVFPKYVSSFSGAVSTVMLPAGSTDWEIEVVVIIGRTAREVPVERGWDHVAGLTAGQDLSERDLQRSGPAPQFGMAKSFPGFSPMGPSLVTPDELDDPDDLALGCSVNGEEVQKARSSDMIFSIPALVSYLSGIVTLYPGDLIYTGTPPGVGMGRTPPRYLAAGDQLHSWVDGIGELRQDFIDRPGTRA
jgi:2-keto-4-pentenoate hydratase/2-oxohepta-3-ene-1,7-dioic acid hydratase in catechol pathway